jgi:hypothetical protein
LTAPEAAASGVTVTRVRSRMRMAGAMSREQACAVVMVTPRWEFAANERPSCITGSPVSRERRQPVGCAQARVLRAPRATAVAMCAGCCHESECSVPFNRPSSPSQAVRPVRDDPSSTSPMNGDLEVACRPPVLSRTIWHCRPDAISGRTSSTYPVNSTCRIRFPLIKLLLVVRGATDPANGHVARQRFLIAGRIRSQKKLRAASRFGNRVVPART